MNISAQINSGIAVINPLMEFKNFAVNILISSWKSERMERLLLKAKYVM
jgi:hypothetical protein